MPMRSRGVNPDEIAARRRFPVRMGPLPTRSGPSNGRVDGHPTPGRNALPGVPSTTERWSGNGGSGRTDGEGAGSRPGKDAPLPPPRPRGSGAIVRLHARRRGGRNIFRGPHRAVPLPRPAGSGEQPCGSAPFSSFERFPQRGKDLGEKMWDAAATAFRRGARRVVIVGADCPSLSAGTVRRAFRELSTGASVVFGPSADGGYYLVGLSCPDERLFRKFTWSTPTVLLDTVARCRALSIPFSFLPPERDVDTGKDLHALREWARTHARPACPRTREWITGFFGPGGGGFPGSPERTPGPPRGSRSRRGG